MRKLEVKNDRPDRKKSLILSPMMAAVAQAFAPRKPTAPSQQEKAVHKENPLAPAVTPQPSVRFEALEPRVLLSGDVNPAALTISGAISVQGEQDYYEFSVEESRRVIFDSLTDRSDINWTLDGPSGQITSRSFKYTDSSASSTAFELTPGKYKLTVDALQDALGSYALRIIDADAAAPMTPGVAVTGTLDSGNKTAVYKFAGTAGDKFIFPPGVLSNGAAQWRLVDPYGRQEGDTHYVTELTDTFTLQRTGEYLFVLEGGVSNTVPVNYQFNLKSVQDSTTPIALDTTVVAHIDQSGKTANFTFTLTDETPVLFDKLTNTNFRWSLTGPQGVKVGSHWTNDYWNGYDNTETSFDGFAHLLLQPGTYTLAVRLQGIATGTLPFRLLSVQSAHSLNTNAPMSASLDFSNGSIIYKVALNQGEKIYLDGQSLTGGALGWRLIDPYGVRVNGSALTTAVSPFVVNTTGDYWLVLDGSDGNTVGATVSYRFALNRVSSLAQTLVVGQPVAGNIGIAGQATVYSFDLAAGTQLAFDAQSNRSDLLWSLAGPAGVVVADRRFDQSDAASGFSVLSLPAGHYQLSVRGSDSAMGAYAFKLMDLVNAATLTRDAAIVGTLTPGNSAQAYRFTAAAGDLVAFQSNSVSAGNATWRLVDRFGRDVAGANDLAVSHAAFALTTGGLYTLLVEGRLDGSAPISFSVQLNSAGNQAPVALPDGDALSLGVVVAGTLASGDETHVYRFTLAHDSQIVMDVQTNDASNAAWKLVGPRGVEVDSQVLKHSGKFMTLSAGEYALTLRGVPEAYDANYFSGDGAYAFQLLDAANFPSLIFGQATAATRSPANATLGWRFEATAGSTLVYTAGTAHLRMVDPYGRDVPSVYGSNGDSYAIVVSGTYTLLDEGDYSVNGATNISLTLSQQTITQSQLALNDHVSGSLAGRQSLDQYSFTVDQTSAIVVDILDRKMGNASSLQLMLTGPKGDVTGWVGLSGWMERPIELPPGCYTITLRNVQDLAASYRFRVLNRDAAVDLTLGADVNDAAPPDETRLYRFNANAGENFYFDGKATYQNDNYYWYLVDPFGKTISSGSTAWDYVDLAASSTGEYLFVVSAFTGYAFFDTLSGAKFALVPKVVSTAALALGEDIHGSIARPAETVKYSFTLVAPTTLLVDAGNATRSPFWSLTGPRGSEVSLRSFGSAEDSLIALPAGTYEFSVTYGDLTTGDFHFRLVDAFEAPVLAVNALTPLTLPPTNYAQAYQLRVVGAGDFMFDPATCTRSSNWRIVDRFGHTLRSGRMDSRTEPFSLADGSYFFVVDSTNSSVGEDQFTFTFRRIDTAVQTLVFNTDVAGSIGVIGQRYDYSFTTNTPTTVLFDSLSNRSDLTWELTGPTGPLRSDISFNVADEGAVNAPVRLDAAGVYHLRVVPRGAATGAFNFRLLNLSDAPALPLGSAQTLSLNPGSSTKVFSLDVNNLDDYLALNLASVSGGMARVWVIDPDGTHLTTVANAVANSTVSAAFKKTGRYTVVIEGAIGNTDLVDLRWVANLVRPKVAALALGTLVTGASAVLGVPDKWSFSLNATHRLVLDGLSGQAHSWTLRDANGAVVRADRLGGVGLFVLAAGAYTLDVQANSVGALGAYSLRLLDVAASQTLSLDQENTATLESACGTTIFKVKTTQAEAVLALDAASTNGEVGTVYVFDSVGNQVGYQALPLAHWNATVQAGGASESSWSKVQHKRLPHWPLRLHPPKRFKPVLKTVWAID